MNFKFYIFHYNQAPAIFLWFTLTVLWIGCSMGAREFVLSGDAKMNTGDCAGAIGDYTNALLIDSNSFKAFHNRALCYMKSGETSSALVDLNAAIRINGNDPTARYNRALARITSGNPMGALKDAIMADSLSEHSINTNLLKANCLFQLGIYKEAIPFYTASLKEYPDSFSIYKVRGISNYMTGNYMNCYYDETQFLKNQPGSVTGIKYLARTLYHLDSIEASITNLENLLKLEDDPEEEDTKLLSMSYCRLGIKYAGQGKFPESVKLYTQALTLDPSNSEAYFQRGLLQVKYGQIFEGCEDLSNAFENGHNQAIKVMQLTCSKYMN